ICGLDAHRPAARNRREGAAPCGEVGRDSRPRAEELGMRFERLILTLGTLAVGCVGSAAMALDPLDAIGVCSRISKKDARLECYDQVARDSASGRLQSSAPASQQGWAAPVGGAQTP